LRECREERDRLLKWNTELKKQLNEVRAFLAVRTSFGIFGISLRLAYRFVQSHKMQTLIAKVRREKGAYLYSLIETDNGQSANNGNNNNNNTPYKPTAAGKDSILRRFMIFFVFVLFCLFYNIVIEKHRQHKCRCCSQLRQTNQQVRAHSLVIRIRYFV
jgi:hypothetical protein